MVVDANGEITSHTGDLTGPVTARLFCDSGITDAFLRTGESEFYEQLRLEGEFSENSIVGTYVAYDYGPSSIDGSFSLTQLPAYTNASLNGDYAFVFTEVYDPGSTTYIDEGGILRFNGDGTALVIGRQRESDGASVTTTISNGTIYYNVNDDGIFALSDQATDLGQPSGQIVLDGNGLLMNNSLNEDGAEVWELVALKKVTAESPPIYTNASLSGDYLYIHTEVDGPDSTTYCNEEGTLRFNGDGTALVAGKTRCADGTTVEITASYGTLYYDVAADGSFTLSDQVADPQPLHGQITLDGNSLLWDGTLDTTSVWEFLNQGVAMKR